MHKKRGKTLHNFFVCLFERTPFQRKESWYSIIWEFASSLWLVLMVIPPLQANPKIRKNIPTFLGKVKS